MDNAALTALEMICTPDWAFGPGYYIERLQRSKSKTRLSLALSQSSG